MRPILDLDGDYAFVVAVQFELRDDDDQGAKLRTLDAILAQFPRRLPFRAARRGAAPCARARGGGARRAARVRGGCAFAVAPDATAREPLDLPATRDALRALARSPAAGGSPALLHAVVAADDGGDGGVAAADLPAGVRAGGALATRDAIGAAALAAALPSRARPRADDGGDALGALFLDELDGAFAALDADGVACCAADMRVPGLPLARA